MQRLIVQQMGIPVALLSHRVHSGKRILYYDRLNIPLCNLLKDYIIVYSLNCGQPVAIIYIKTLKPA